MKRCCSKNWLSFFKAACNEHREMILEILRHHQSLNAGQIVKKMHLSQPTISHHLKILSDASLVEAKRMGKEVRYSLNIHNITNCCHGFMKLFSSKPDDISY